MSKPECNLVGEDGNIFNLLGIAGKTLKSNELSEQVSEMQSRVFKANSYEDALNIISEYVEIV